MRLLDSAKAERLLDEMIHLYESTHTTPSAKLEPPVLEAAARRWTSIDDAKQNERHQAMLRAKTQAQRLWYEICDLMQKNTLAAVAGLGTCESAGTGSHSKRCTSIAKKLAKLDPAFQVDCRSIDKLMLESCNLFPWNDLLLKGMAMMEDSLLVAK